MRRPIALIALTTLLLVLATPVVLSKQLTFDPESPLRPHNNKQDPSFPSPGLLDSGSPPGGADRGIIGGVGSGGMNLAETLTVGRRGGLWWEYARDSKGITKRLEQVGGRSTLLVPVDKAIVAMPRKPHQSQDGSADDEKAMQANIEKFIAGHVIAGEVEMPSKGAVKTLRDGVEVEIEGSEAAGWQVVRNGARVAVLDVKEASNGKILYLDGVIVA